MRVAAVWAVINLSWREDPAAARRIEKLKNLGFEAKLRDMANDRDIDVKDRVRTALQHFQSDVSDGRSRAQSSGEIRTSVASNQLMPFEPAFYSGDSFDNLDEEDI